MEYTYRDIIKAKAEALARAAAYGSDYEIKLCLHDLAMFRQKCRNTMSLGYVYDDTTELPSMKPSSTARA